MRPIHCAAWLAMAFIGCGGSSSETPPPLEPDPARLHGAPVEPTDPPAPIPPAQGASVPGAELRPAEPEPAAAPLPALPVRRGPASSTWGSKPPAPDLAPEPE